MIISIGMYLLVYIGWVDSELRSTLQRWFFLHTDFVWPYNNDTLVRFDFISFVMTSSYNAIWILGYAIHT